MKKLDILFEDEHVVILNKPAGLLTLPDRFKPERPNLLDWLTKIYGKIWTVHRLDKDTSGVICFAKNETAHRELSLKFENRAVKKIYHLITQGRISPEEGTIDKGIANHPTKGGRMMVSAKGKVAVTTYKTLEQFKAFSYVEANILTGRTHQIRVHFQSIGFPLAVDPTYGNQEAFYLSEVKGRNYRKGKNQEERPLMNRHTLHAQALEVEHPISNEMLHVEAPLPKDFKAVLNQLRKWGR